MIILESITSGLRLASGTEKGLNGKISGIARMAAVAVILALACDSTQRSVLGASDGSGGGDGGADGGGNGGKPSKGGLDSDGDGFPDILELETGCPYAHDFQDPSDPSRPLDTDKGGRSDGCDGCDTDPRDDGLPLYDEEVFACAPAPDAGVPADLGNPDY